MRSLLIKIGKAFATIRREGLIKGGRRVIKNFFALFRRVGIGDVLFVTAGVGDSARYRCDHYAEELRIHGFRCSVTVQDNPFLSGYADKFSIFIFHRTLYSPGVAKLISRIKKQKKEIIFETDDLIFDSKYLVYMDGFSSMNYFEKKQYENGVGGEILEDPYVKACSTTTSFLKKKMEEKNKKVFIISNKLSREDLKNARDILKSKKLKAKEANEAIMVGYFSGSVSHNKDFAEVETALRKILEKYPQVRLFLAGPLYVNSILTSFQDKIEQIPYAPRDQHFLNISQVDINVAPLEIGNPFCEAKSELKFFEAGIVKVPTVASATQTFKEAINDGVDGFLASNEEDWFRKLEKLILDADLRNEMGAKAFEKTMKNYTTKNSRNEEYYKFLRSRITI